MGILLDWLPPYSHYSPSLLKLVFTPWNTGVLLKWQPCQTGFFDWKNPFDWNKWKLKHLYDRPKWFMYQGHCTGRFPVRAPGLALFSVEHSFHTGVLAQNNSSIWSRMWKRKACGLQREHWLLRRRQSKSADLFHAAVPISISELHTQWRFTEYLFPFSLCSHTPLGTWLNNDYGIDAWICLQISMAGIMKEGGSVRSYINAMWTFCWNQSLKWSFSGTGILTRSSGLYGFIFLTFYIWEKK